jgi:hypothetical protein
MEVHMNNNKMLRVLILLRQRVYGDYTGCFTGLKNSANFVKEWLERIGVPVKLEVVVDGNSIDKEVHDFKPTHCVIEAIWPTPDKMRELVQLHPTVLFVVRVHSELGFLANEGMSIEWLKAYDGILGVLVAFNSSFIKRDLEEAEVVAFSAFLPNIYPAPARPDWWRLFKKSVHRKLGLGQYGCLRSGRINVGCLGAVRPLKNHLQQAVAALEVAERLNVRLNFHVNEGRVEQRGEPVVKNLRALFMGTDHALVEHAWLSRTEFLKLVSTMDAGMQVSFTESFSIVSADFVGQGVPVVASPAVRWLPFSSQASPINGKEIADKLENLLWYPAFHVGVQQLYLSNYSKSAEREWRNFLGV